MGKLFDDEFKIGSLHKNGKECEKFTKIYHVCHIKNAIQIIRDGMIECRIPDEDMSCISKLNIPITWTSPREWGDGSPFGNIKFGFDWEFISGKGVKSYKINDEGILQDHETSTYRILFTQNIYENSNCLTAYDPTSGEGPVLHKIEQWYRNENHYGQFMIESDLTLNNLTDIEFIKHRESRDCRTNCTEPRSCVWVGPLFMANLLGYQLKLVNSYFIEHGAGKTKLTTIADAAISNLQRDLIELNEGISTTFSFNHETAFEIMRDALIIYSELDFNPYPNNHKNKEKSDEINKLLGILGSKEQCNQYFIDLVREHFNIDVDTYPRKRKP